MYEVNYNGRTSRVSNYFYCRIRLERLLCDAERDLLVIAKFLVLSVMQKNKRVFYLKTQYRSTCVRVQP